MKCSWAWWGWSWITKKSEGNIIRLKETRSELLPINYCFFVQGKQQKCKGGEVKCSLCRIWVFVGNWPRLQTSINQSHASVSNKDAAVVTLQQIHYFQTHTLVADILVHNECTSHRWLAALLITWPPTACSVVLSGTRCRWRASTSGSPSTRLSSYWALYETEQIAFWKWKASCLNKMSLKSFQREICFSRSYFNSMERISESLWKDKFSIAAAQRWSKAA